MVPARCDRGKWLHEDRAPWQDNSSAETYTQLTHEGPKGALVTRKMLI